MRTSDSDFISLGWGLANKCFVIPQVTLNIALDQQRWAGMVSLSQAFLPGAMEAHFPPWRIICGFLPVASSGMFSIQWTRGSGQGRKMLWGGRARNPPGRSLGRVLWSRPLSANCSVSGESCGVSHQPAASCWKPPNGSSHRSSGNGGWLEPKQAKTHERKGGGSGQRAGLLDRM